MTPGRWKQVESIFEQALDLPQEDRAKFLNRNCDGDQELRCEVDSLLDSHASAALFIDEPSLFILDEDTKQEERGIAPGQLLGAYRILREIGRGGMGAVYLAERADEQYKKLVAIKLIKRGMDTDAVLRRFRNERQILAGFDHPNIARLFDGGTTHGGLPYFVMEHVEGMPINEYCAAHKISLVERLKLFREVCAAVSYAHRHTVIHRDIKMSNILVTSDGTPKLLDFGIAKILRPDNAAESMLTFTGMRPMTPEYASPEQVRGEAVTTASDVYSLGVVLYELLTGTSPYQLTTHAPRDVEHAITEQEPKKPSTVAREPRFESRESSDSRFTIDNSRALRGDLDNIVLMALRKEAARRYQTVEQFADDICRHLEERPVLARRDTFGYRAAKFIQRNKVATIAAVLILVSLVVGLIMTTWEAHRAKLEKTRAEERFKDVRQLAHSVLFDYHDAIKDLPGATHVRERLVKDALTYLDKLAAEATGDPGLQRELASAYERVGDVRGQAYGASLGDMTGAMESYLKALLIREALVAANPKEVQSRRDLTRSYVRIGRQLIETNEAARGTNYLRKALAICVQLSVEQAASTEILSDLASAYNELGISLEDWWGDASGALENHRKALALREKFVAADPENQIHQRNLSVTYVNLSRALVLSGDIKGGLESNGKALAIRKALFAANPNNADYRRLLAITYQNDGNYRALLHDVAGALQSFRNKLVLNEQAVAQDPVNVQASEDLGYSCERIGDLLAESGNDFEALSYYRKALDMYEKVSTVAPQILHLRYRVIFARAGIGRMQANLGNRALALAECSKANARLNEIPLDATISWQTTMRAQLYMQLGQAYAALATSKNVARTERREHWSAARDQYQRSLAIWKDMQQRGILTPDNAPKLDEMVRDVAECDAALASKE